MIALHLRDAFIALALPVGNRIHLVPCVEQLRLLARVSGCIGHAYRSRCAQWHRVHALVVRQLFFEIDLHGALTVLAFAAIPLAVHKVAAIAIHLAD